MDLKFLQKPDTGNEKWMITLVNDSTDEPDDRALKTVCLSMKKSIKNKLIGAKKPVNFRYLAPRKALGRQE